MTSLPRLIYVGDIPVEATYHGSALIYRLLQKYPTSRILVVEQSQFGSSLERRLTDVRYEQIRFPFERLLRSRFAKIVSSGLLLGATSYAGEIDKLLRGFQPQGVLTVAHGFSWLTAGSFARRHRVPLHLIVHDDWPRTTGVVRMLKPWMEKRFAEVYRAATSRLCVSPYMVAEYERRYGVRGSVLYPSRSADTPVFGPISAHQLTDKRPFTVAFAGSLNTPDYVRQLAILSHSVAEIGGRLLLFGPFDGAALLARGARMENVVLSGLVTSEALVRRLRSEADLLFLPMSFADGDADSFALNFPSKLTDYTAVGLPILVWGPKSSSGVNWARSEPGVAVIVTDRTGKELLAVLRRLSEDADWRFSLSKSAVEVGKRYFSPDQAQANFYAAVAKIT